MSQQIEETITGLLSQVRTGESISPNDVAKTLNPEGWRRELPKIKAVITGLARKGDIEIMRKGKPIDVDEAKGIYRIRLPVEK